MRSPSQSGNGPLMLQLAMNRASKLTSADRQLGSGSAVKLLPPVYSPRLSSLRLVRLLMEAGTLPDSWLPNSCSSSRQTSLPISVGIRPVRPQRQMHSRRSVEIVHSSFGIMPIRPVKEMPHSCCYGRHTVSHL